MKTAELVTLIDDGKAFNFLAEVMIRKFAGLNNVLNFEEPEAAMDYLQGTYLKSPVECAVFLDINMPTLSGWDVLDDLENFPSETKKRLSFYIVSSSIDADDKDKAAQYQLVKEFLCKPFTKEAIKRILNPVSHSE